MLDAIVRGFKKLWDVSDDVSPGATARWAVFFPS